MNQPIRKLTPTPKLGASVAALIAMLCAGGAQAAFNSGSTGADGAFNPVVNTEVQLPPSGILNYTSVNIPAGVTVKFKRNQANTPVYILASGDVTIAGAIDVRGGDSTATGTYGDGVLGDDALPGQGGPGGFDGGRGGREDAAQRPEVVRGGGGLGPGGGAGGIEGADGCNISRYHKYIGSGGAYAADTYSSRSNQAYCGNIMPPLSKAYGSALLQPLIGGSGGGGGGALLIASSGTLRITGSIDATGGDAGGVAGANAGGYGAGGSGGAVRLVATTVTGNGKLYANGGCLNVSNQRRQSCGWQGNYGEQGGSPGRIRIEGEAITFNGSSEPAYVGDTPGPVFIAEAPSLRIASIAGQTVPANPTGNADVTLPATTTGPVEVQFQTTNVPVGNTVLLRVVPAYGNTTEVLSPAIAGSTASGTASVSVTLPQGPSTLQATATYTVVVAEGHSLSHLAQNEAVEKVEVTVSLTGETTARLITASGKSYSVPYGALRAAGFQG